MQLGRRETPPIRDITLVFKRACSELGAKGKREGRSLDRGVGEERHPLPSDTCLQRPQASPRQLHSRKSQPDLSDRFYFYFSVISLLQPIEVLASLWYETTLNLL